MTFDKIPGKVSDLNAQYRSGRLTREQYYNQINSLRIQDSTGRWWQPDPDTGGWIFWNGTGWQPGTPPLESLQTSPPPPPKVTCVPPLPHVPPSSLQENGDRKLMDMESFRQISRSQPWHKRPQKWWDLFSILGGVAAAAIWFLYSSASPRSEGLDLITPLLMVGIPFVLVTFRKDIDNLLVPIQPHRRRVSKMVLIGMSIAVPFLTAFFLYNFFKISQYSLMHWNIIIGTCISYALVREPVLATVPPGQQQGQNPIMTYAKTTLFLYIAISVIVRIVNADHCLTDPLNAQDCLRSGGYAEGIAGGASTGESVLVNGPEIVRNISGPGSYIPGGMGAAGTAPASQAGTSAATVPETERQMQEWINNTPYLRDFWRIKRDADGNAIGVYLDTSTWRRADGSTYPLTEISAEDIRHYQIYTEPVPAQIHDVIAGRASSHLTDEDIRNIGSRSRWQNMTEQDRRQFIQRLVNLFGSETGNNNIPVRFMTPAEGGPEHACFDHVNNDIRINPNSPVYHNRRDLIRALGHEIRHEEQYSPRDMENPQTTNMVWENRNNYNDLDKDPSAYAAQYLERDAESYGDKLFNHVRQSVRDLKNRLSRPPAPPAPGKR